MSWLITKHKMGSMLSSMAQKLFGTKLTPLENAAALSPLVFRILGDNPGFMTLQGTNSYLVGAGSEKILIDTSEPGKNGYIDTLKGKLKEELGGANIKSIICTHWHSFRNNVSNRASLVRFRDHVGSVSDVVSKVVAPENHSTIKIFKFPRISMEDDTSIIAPYSYETLTDGQIIEVDGATLKVVYSPGHSDDHAVLYLEEENAVFSGDAILGEGTTVFEDLYTYMKSLQLILDLKPNRIYPGHGPVIEDGQLKVREYIDHRNQREAQILAALKTSTDVPLTPKEIVKKVYTDLSFHLVPAAAINVSHHLSKLVKEGKVQETAEGSRQFLYLQNPKL